MNRRIPPLIFAVCLLAGSADSFSADSLSERYLASLGYASAGDPAAAIKQLEQLAELAPASIPVHRSLALLALQQGDEVRDEWSSRFRRRLRRSRHDVGAAVGRGLILERVGRTREAHNLLLSAVMSGARSPLLSAPLCRTSHDAAGLFGWMRTRARAIGRDPAFAAMRVEVMLACGATAEAGQLVGELIERYPRSPRLLVLHAAWLRAAGDERAAGQQAALAVGLPREQGQAPEVRIPERLSIARALGAAGLIEQGRAVLATVGPLLVPPGQPSPEGALRVVQAELALDGGDPIRALVRLETAGELSGAWQETRRSVELRALADLGLDLPPAASLAGAAWPAGLECADRAVAVVRAAATSPALGDEDRQALEIAVAALDRAGFAKRAARLELLLASRLPHEEGEIRLEAAMSRVPAGASGGLPAARRLIETRWALAAGEPAAALEIARLTPLEVTSTPGRLLAALHTAQGRAALATGTPAAALEAFANALLDLQEADMVAMRTPEELRSLERAEGELPLRLPGLALRADRAAGLGADEAEAHLLQNIGRAARDWSVLTAPWGDSPGEIAGGLPAGSCLVLATSEPDAPWLLVGPAGAKTVPAGELASGPCADAQIVFHAGPAAPEGGLTTLEPVPRPLIRVVRPLRLARRETGEDGAELPQAGLLGAGEEQTALSLVVRRLSGPGAELPADRASKGGSVFAGPGLSSMRAPLASGWLVPPESDGRSWLTADWLLRTRGQAGRGLAALGIRAVPRDSVAEKGLWVIAEAGLEAGWDFVLLSRRPLTSGELATVWERWPRWQRSPAREAMRLARQDPALAAELTLWSAPDRLRGNGGGAAWWAVPLALLVATGLIVVWIRRRRRRN